ncbi:MAG: hypothetical protein AABZ00_05130 [Chloroflexota bacterium]
MVINKQTPLYIFDTKTRPVQLLGLISLFILLVGLACMVSAVSQMTFTGKVVNSQTGEWPNNRLVLVFFKNVEIGRDTTKTGTTKTEGVVDGAFSIAIPNTYQLTVEQLNESGTKFETDEFGGIFHWFGEFEEGSAQSISIPSKNIEYVIKVIDGDISTLPPELLQPGSANLQSDGSIVVKAPATNNSTAVSLNSEVQVNDINISGSESSDLGAMTIPIAINNCGGNSKVTQGYSRTQTFIHEFNAGVGVKIGVDFSVPIWASVSAELENQYNFKQGQVDTRTLDTELAAEPNTNVKYTITWQEIWDYGEAEVTDNATVMMVPFRVKKELSYSIESENLGCP